MGRKCQQSYLDQVVDLATNGKWERIPFLVTVNDPVQTILDLLDAVLGLESKKWNQ